MQFGNALGTRHTKEAKHSNSPFSARGSARESARMTRELSLVLKLSRNLNGDFQCQSVPSPILILQPCTKSLVSVVTLDLVLNLD